MKLLKAFMLSLSLVGMSAFAGDHTYTESTLSPSIENYTVEDCTGELMLEFNPYIAQRTCRSLTVDEGYCVAKSEAGLTLEAALKACAGAAGVEAFCRGHAMAAGVSKGVVKRDCKGITSMTIARCFVKGVRSTTDTEKVRQACEGTLVR